MATIKISELQEVVSLSENDTLPITNQGETKQVAVSKLGDILATKEYVNKTISEQADMGFTPIIVDELPTYEIETNTIYMILSEDSDGDNIYEEWMYINNKWEKVGSTGKTSGDDSCYTFDINITGSFRSGYRDGFQNDYSNVNFDSDTIAKLSEEITKAYAAGFAAATVNFYFNGNFLQKCTTTTYGTGGNTTSTTLQNKPKTIYFITPFIDEIMESATNIRQALLYRITVNGAWADGVFTCSGGYARRYSVDVMNYNRTMTQIYNNTVYKTNTTAFTPTSDYHPATKKYVDDSIKTSITSALDGDY